MSFAKTDPSLAFLVSLKSAALTLPNSVTDNLPCLIAEPISSAVFKFLSSLVCTPNLLKSAPSSLNAVKISLSDKASLRKVACSIIPNFLFSFEVNKVLYFNR